MIEPHQDEKPGRHRRLPMRARALGRTIGLAGALVLIAGGTAAAGAAGPSTPELTASLASASVDAAAQTDARAAAIGRADRSRAVQATASVRNTAKQRAAWLRKTTAAQRALAQKLSAGTGGDNEIALTPKTLAVRKAAAAKAAAAKAAADRAAAAARTAAKAKAAKAADTGGTSTSTSGAYVLPVSSGVNSDTFGMTGPHWAHRHTGQDFPVPLGTGVRAISSGKVLETGWAGAFGNRMKLLLDDGTEIWYCHLSSYVVTGGRVSAGETVARSGSTGNSTGPHLHVEVHLNQNPVASDPLDWLRSKGLSI